MTRFDKTYIKLLRDQVEVEIKYLQSQGHSGRTATVPCIFCYPGRHGGHECGRMTELKQFHSQLVVRQKGFGEIEQVEYERRPIGQEIGKAPDVIHSSGSLGSPIDLVPDDDAFGTMSFICRN